MLSEAEHLDVELPQSGVYFGGFRKTFGSGASDTMGPGGWVTPILSTPYVQTPLVYFPNPNPDTNPNTDTNPNPKPDTNSNFIL